MVDRIPEAERQRAARRIGAGFAAVVGISAGLMAYRSGATLLVVGVATTAGLLFGAALLVVLAGPW